MFMLFKKGEIFYLQTVKMRVEKKKNKKTLDLASQEHFVMKSVYWDKISDIETFINIPESCLLHLEFNKNWINHMIEENSHERIKKIPGAFSIQMEITTIKEIANG